ncbi:hypothetical protein H5410_064556 [Solanum commersonii]|uniref:Uncharacterized protein n=1 Tax=Solanum commersonii TaxID=4109 RepID=A0A9J5VZ18_SOLCO|nr:hypothetical protein H5410_064556 [Solanum commersonii]
MIVVLSNVDYMKVFELRDKTWTLWSKRNKAAGRTENRRPEDRLSH